MPPVNRLLRIILILADQIIRFEIYNPNSEVNRWHSDIYLDLLDVVF